MDKYVEIDFNRLTADLLELCSEHQLKPNGLVLQISLETKEYQRIKPKYQSKTHPDMIYMSSETGGVIWNIKILRRMDPSDFPPLTPPTNVE